MEAGGAALPQHKCGMSCGVKRYSSVYRLVLITLLSFHQVSALLITKGMMCVYVKAQSPFCVLACKAIYRTI